MSVILGSERSLFDRHIIAANLNVDDFEINKESDAPGTTILTGTGTVTVIYKPTDISSRYRDGVYPPPHVEFERELKNFKFKR